MNERKLLRPLDAVIIIIVLIAAALSAFILSASEEGAYAVITCNGETVDSISLTSDGDYTYAALPGMVFTVSEGSVAVTESGCAGRICVRSGKISRKGETLICVPNRAAVSIGGGRGDVDVII